LYAVREINVVLFEGKYFQDRKMQKKINQLENHYIICGFGRMGRKIAQELQKRSKPFVVIEKDIENQEEIEKYFFLHSNATEDESLLKAGIMKAKGLVSVLSSDTENTFTTLSARQLNPKLKIIARAEEESSREKILIAGADKVILPYEIGGFRITQALLKPSVVDYIDQVFARSDLGLEIEEITLTQDSPLINKTLADSGIRTRFNIIIVGIYRADGELIYNPRSDTKLNTNDILIVIGKTDELQKFQ
jgi:voltage-gated potassium channel